jgi:5S rRNA maturation endonuclease (ribonuclease M5)
MSVASLPSIERVAELLDGEVSGGQVLCPGPGHSAGDRSLSVLPDVNAPDGFVVHSFADDDPLLCRDFVRTKLGLPAFEPGKKRKANGKANGKWSPLAEYTYRDAHGEPYLLVKKYLDANGKKQFPQFHWDGKQWLEGKPAGPKIPYRLPELLAAPVTTTVFFCEGEKDDDNLTKLSFVATTASEGANASWDPALTQYFKDRPVVILMDADKPGRAHGQKVAKALNGVAASVKVVDLFPDKNDGSDVSDWLEDDRVGSRLAKLAKESDEWKPSADDSKADTNKADEALIFELAALTKLQYAKRRKEAADEIGITVSALDKIVAEARGESKDKEPAPALYEHWNVEPWDEAVDGDVLLRALVEAIRRYVVMSDEQMLVVASWLMLTWLHEQIVVHSPVLLVTSPLPNSGKTTLLKVASFLVRNGLSSVSITGPALFRSIEKWAPTIAIDEADTAIINNDDLKDVINGGWTRGETVIRCDDKTHEPRPYSTFCPKAIGMIGRKLPPATLSRCLVIALRRKRQDEEADDFDHVDNEHLARLRSQLLRWATDNAEVLGKAKPEKPPGLHNRTWMNWRLLLAITEQCNWKQAAWKAVRAIEEVHAASDPELGVQLLADIRDAFDRLGDRIPTKALIEALTEDPEGPLAVLRQGRQADQRASASRAAQRLPPGLWDSAEGATRHRHSRHTEGLPSRGLRRRLCRLHTLCCGKNAIRIRNTATSEHFQ